MNDNFRLYLKENNFMPGGFLRKTGFAIVV